MSIFSKIGRALGFGDETTDESDECLALPQSEESQIEKPDPTVPLSVDSEQVGRIFERALEIFNGALPDFLSRSVNPEAQSQALYDALDQGVKQYLQSLRTTVQSRCEAAWAIERDRLVAEANDLRQQTIDLESKRAEIKDRQLSADRQKRALNERVKDLEAKVMTLEAEKEQLDLECKSMVNKIRAVAVLETELEELRQSSQPASAPVADTAETVALNAQIEALTQQLAQANAENEKLRDNMETAQVKDDMSQAMQADFQKRAAEANKQLKGVQEELDGLKETLLARDARIDDLQKEALQKEARLAELEKTIEEKEEELRQTISQDDLAELQQQMTLFEEVKEKMDNHILKLKESLKASQAENESLRQTIKTNLMQNAEVQHRMRIRIEELQKNQSSSEPEPIEDIKIIDKSQASKEEDAPAQPKRSTPMSDVHDLLQGADWLVSTPPKEQSMRDADDSEPFGYQPPARKTKAPDNDAQLSLFDF